MFAITSFRCIEVLFHVFYNCRSEEHEQFFIPKTSLDRGSLNRGSTVFELER